MMKIIDAEVERIVRYLNDTDGLRVSRSGVVHTAWCSTQQLTLQRPEVLPWPEFASPEDRACKRCAPDLSDRDPFADLLDDEPDGLRDVFVAHRGVLHRWDCSALPTPAKVVGVRPGAEGLDDRPCAECLLDGEPFA